MTDIAQYIEPAIFGKDFQVSWTPMAKDKSIAIDSIVTARLYLGLPNELQRLDHTGVLLAPNDPLQISVTNVAGTFTNELLITFADIVDPAPTSDEVSDLYYYVVSFLAEVAGQTIASRPEGIEVFRADAIILRFGVTPTILIQYENKLADCYTVSELQEKIARAERDVLRFFRRRGYHRREIKESDARDAVIFKALEYAARSAASDTDDIWDSKSIDYREQTKSSLNAAYIGRDMDGDDAIEESEEAQFPAIFITR